MNTGAGGEKVRLRSTDLQWRIVGGEVVILDTGESRYLSVNETGAALWPLLAEGATVSEMVAALREQFDVDDAQAAADVAHFVGALRGHGLLDDAGEDNGGGG